LSDSQVIDAPLWRRIGAALVDTLAISIVLLVLTSVYGIVLASAFGDADPSQSLAAKWVPPALLVIVPWLYFARFERGGKAYTFGKSTFHIQVGDTQGEALGFKRALLRQPLKLVLFWTLPLVAFGRPALYDQILGARVYRSA
jgi:uncharacterized RDD family membrane protein YckC